MPFKQGHFLERLSRRDRESEGLGRAAIRDQRAMTLSNHIVQMFHRQHAENIVLERATKLDNFSGFLRAPYERVKSNLR